MRTVLETKQTARARVRDMLVGATTRTAVVIAAVANVVTRRALTTIDAATFGLFNDRAGNDVCSITAGAKVLTSPDLPWTAADVGKAIDVAGAGTAGGTLRSVIDAFASAGSITLRHAAVTTVAATVTSAAGLAMWGYPTALVLRSQTLRNIAGDAMYSLTPGVTGGAGRAVGDILGEEINVLDFTGVDPTGVTDSTAAIQAAIDAAAGRIVRLPAGTYACDLLALDVAGLSLVGDGAGRTIIEWSGVGDFDEGDVNGQSGTCAILVTADGCSIEGLSISGPTSAAYEAFENGVVVCGASAADRVDGFTMRHCEVTGVGSMGISCVFADGVEIDHVESHHNGDMGIGFVSCAFGHVHHSHVHHITPGTAGNMYGISMSHDSVLWPGDQATSPFTDDMRIEHNRVEHINWEGISNHGGNRHTIIGNVIYNVQAPIGIQGSSGGAAGYSGSDHLVMGNDCDGGPDYAFVKYCNFGSGAATELMRNLQIIGNRFRRLGIKDNASNGALRLQFCRHAIIADNIVSDWHGAGIYVAGAGSADVSIRGNSISALHAADTQGFAIRINEDIPAVRISGNAIRTDGGTIATRGIYTVTQTEPAIITGNQIEATTLATATNLTDGDLPGYSVITASAGTYSVAADGAHRTLIFNLGGAQAVTDFTGARNGQRLTIVNVSANNLTLTRSAIMRLVGSADIVLDIYDAVELVNYAGVWFSTGPKGNNG